jgi:hypothetical protein
MGSGRMDEEMRGFKKVLSKFTETLRFLFGSHLLPFAVTEVLDFGRTL